MLNQDFKEILYELVSAQAEFLVVGAYALAAHGLPRATGDIDIWVRPTIDNSKRVYSALLKFGAPLSNWNITPKDLETEKHFIQMGVPPRRIDILTKISGVTFEEAWPPRLIANIDGLEISIISKEHLIKNKRAAGRPKDLVDVLQLENSMQPDKREG